MDPTVSTLLGVLLGGSIASGTSFYVERLRAARDATARAKRERGDARRAARLLAEELEYGRRLIDRAQAKGYYTWEPPKRLIPAAAWTEYRADFALVASDEEWETAAVAFAEFDRLNWHLSDVIEEEHWTNTGPQHPLEPRDLTPSANVAGALEKVDAALGLLRRLMAGSAVAVDGGTRRGVG